jgi:hypothetical protein
LPLRLLAQATSVPRPAGSSETAQCSRPCVTAPKASPSPPPPTHPHPPPTPPPQQPARQQSLHTVYSLGPSPTHREPSLRRATIVAHPGLATWHGSTRAPSRRPHQRVSRCERHPPSATIVAHPGLATWHGSTRAPRASMNARMLSRCIALRNGKTGRISRATVTLSCCRFPAAAAAPACFFFLFDGAARCSSSSSAVDRARASSTRSRGVAARAAWLSK